MSLNVLNFNQYVEAYFFEIRHQLLAIAAVTLQLNYHFAFFCLNKNSIFVGYLHEIDRAHDKRPVYKKDPDAIG
jgi:hypothetical protein